MLQDVSSNLKKCAKRIIKARSVVTRLIRMSIRTLWSSSSKKQIGFLRMLRRDLSVSSRTVIEKAYKDNELRIFIVCGEVSGDTIGSRLMKSLRKLSPLPVRFSGVGGSMMSKYGLKSVFPVEDISIMGALELLPHLYKIKMRLKETIEAALLFRPHVVVTVDSKGFSFRLLKQLQARYDEQSFDIPVHFHYVAPSFWAWKGGEARLRGLAAFVDHILCILPNEEKVLRENGVAATFVGHPILEDVLEMNSGKSSPSREWKIEGNSSDFKKQNAIPAVFIHEGATVFSVFPGSRLQEVRRMLTVFEKTMKVLHKSLPELVTVVHVASNWDVEKYINGSLQKWPVRAILVPGGCAHMKYDALSASNGALCTSGTVAVEMQLARVPCVVAYRAHFVTELIVRYRAKIPYVSLPNILLESPIIPEALFRECTHTNLAALLLKLLRDESLREEQIVAADKVIRFLSPPETRDSELANQSPSMLAASTILYYKTS